jgi:hypothetical protein
VDARVSDALAAVIADAQASTCVAVNYLLAALQRVVSTVTVKVVQACPVPFDEEAYRTQVAADAGVSRDRVTVTVTCVPKQPLVSEDGASVPQPHRSLQSDAAELIIVVTIAELTAVQAAAVRRVPDDPLLRPTPCPSCSQGVVILARCYG